MTTLDPMTSTKRGRPPVEDKRRKRSSGTETETMNAATDAIRDADSMGLTGQTRSKYLEAREMVSVYSEDILGLGWRTPPPGCARRGAFEDDPSGSPYPAEHIAQFRAHRRLGGSLRALGVAFRADYQFTIDSITEEANRGRASGVEST